MLKYHLLLPAQSKQTLGIFHHYLSLGSHHSPYQFPYINAFSIVTLFPKEKLPDIRNNQVGALRTAIVPLKGKIKIDGQSLDTEKYQKQTIFINPKSVSSFDGYDKSCVFAYLATENYSIEDTGIYLKAYQQQTSLQLNRQFVYVLNGQLTYNQGETEVKIKNSYTFENSVALFYAAEKTAVKLSKNSLVLIFQQKQ